MESVISQKQLETLLQNMKDSVPTTKVIESLNKTYYFSILEKNAFYHGMLEMIKRSSDPKEIALSVLEVVQDLLEKKADLVIQELEVIKAQETGNSSKMSSIFRRVG